MSPDCGTQNMQSCSVAPRNFSCSRGPGTLVMTAVALRWNRFSSASCAGFTSSPATASTAKASSGWVLSLSAAMRRRTS